MHVLVTGSEGSIGKVVLRSLRAAGHRTRGLDLKAGKGEADEFYAGSICDPAILEQVMEGVDSVIHLAAEPDDAPFVEVLLEPNVVGPYRVFEAALQAGVKRVICASTIQVNSPWDLNQEQIRLEDRPLLNNHYAMTKVWVENMALLYAQRRGLSTIAARIGWFPRQPKNAAETNPNLPWLKNWYFSQNDCGRFFRLCVESPRPEPGQCEVLYALGKQLTAPFIDHSRAAEVIGYEPEDAFPDHLTFD